LGTTRAIEDLKRLVGSNYERLQVFPSGRNKGLDIVKAARRDGSWISLRFACGFDDRTDLAASIASSWIQSRARPTRSHPANGHEPAWAWSEACSAGFRFRVPWFSFEVGATRSSAGAATFC